VRSLLKLVEEDATHLRENVTHLELAAKRVVKAQMEMAAAMQHMSDTVTKYGEQVELQLYKTITMCCICAAFRSRKFRPRRTRSSRTFTAHHQ
jgi:hypothetical protein